ncbi:MAG: sulfurtransferase TusA family protein [Candidatus Sedimenticola sp. (ex Thyasira tokunagai)]
MPDQEKVILDARRLLCPMPVIRVQDRVKELSPGTRLEAICSDPGVLNDIPAWSRINGHKLIETREEKGEYIVVIEVVAEA